MNAESTNAVVQRRLLDASLAENWAGMVPSAISGSRRREYIGASSRASKAPIKSATKPIKAISVPKLVVRGAHDPQFSYSDEALTARRIGAPPPVSVPGWHLTMIASPGPVAAAIDSLANRQ